MSIGSIFAIIFRGLILDLKNTVRYAGVKIECDLCGVAR